MASQSTNERLKTLKDALPGSLVFSGDTAFIYLGMEEDAPYVAAPIGDYYYDSMAHRANACILTSLEIVRKDGTTFLDSLRTLKTFSVVSGQEDVKEDDDERSDEDDIKTTVQATTAASGGEEDAE